MVVLGPITPSPESAREQLLEYPNLTKATERQKPFLHDRIATFFAAKEGSVEESRAAQQLAAQYMLLTAHRLQGDAQVRGSEQLWSDRYTQASSELYGAPEGDTVRDLATTQVSTLISQARSGGVDPQLIEYFRQQNESLGVTTREHLESTKPFEVSAAMTGEYIKETYRLAIAALDLDEDTKSFFEPESMAARFEATLAVLARQYDPSWAEWGVERDDSKDQLVVVVGKKKIKVGMRRAPVRAEQMKGLFAHEILVHAQRAINGSKADDKRLERGLPGYLDAEEGLGIFFEYAITGTVPEKNIDRYVDIGIALGMIDGERKSRQQILEFAHARAHIRNELLPIGDRKTNEQIEQEVYAHVNRIYRGSLGNEYIGIFTKDIAYLVGFIKVGTYIESELTTGKPINEIIEYLLQGKFDPTNQKHLAVINSKRRTSE